MKAMGTPRYIKIYFGNNSDIIKRFHLKSSVIIEIYIYIYIYIYSIQYKHHYAIRYM